MGMKIAGVLGLLLVISVAGSAWYIDRLQDEISVLKGNAIALENSIAQQNEQIKEHKAKAEALQNQNNKLASQNQESMREVNQLRNTFASHDLDNLALAKPALIESKVNKAVKRLMQEFRDITDPDQFNEEDNTDG